MPEAKTVRVRVPVAVSADAEYFAHRYSQDRDETAVVWVKYDAARPTMIYWLTAELPVPEEADIEAEVEHA